MKAIKYIVCVCLSAFLTLSLTGCDEWLDINTNPNQPITTTLDQALPPIIFYSAFINYDHAEYGVYMSQALTTSSKSQTGSYPYSQGWEFLGINRHPMWRRHFYDLGANIRKMLEIAEQQNSPNYELIGRTIRLQSTMMTTDLFGDMPRSEAYQKNSPKYDSQEEVYEWLFQEADELVKLYDDPAYTDNPNSHPINEKQDRIYHGDMKKWAAYTKALRCRLWLRKLPNWDNTPANCQRIVQMVDEVLNDPNWEEPRYYFPGGVTESNCPWGSTCPKINSWESRDNRLASSMPTTFFAQGILGAYPQRHATWHYALDPRAEKMMTPRSMGSSDTYGAIRYLESNIGMDNSMKVTYYPDLYASSGNNPFVQNNGYIALMLQEELMFIKAEAQYWAGDVAGAYNTTVEATKYNMDRYGVGNTTSADKKIYDLFFEIKLPGATEFTIADLMQQKYVAMYLQEEQWTDMRRYNYSSKTNGIFYGLQGTTPVPVYTCKTRASSRYNASAYTGEYSLRRPYNLYAPYWDQPDCYEDPSSKAVLSPNAWVNRLNPDTETETKYNSKELIRIGACNANGQVDYHWMQKHLIWAKFNPQVCTCSNSIEWM